MRIDPSQSAATTATLEPHVRPASVERVSPQRTALSRPQIRDALARAYQARHGQPMPGSMLDIVTAHVCHETGAGQSMYNYNFGGIKGASPEGRTAVCGTHEFVNGAMTPMRLGFRAYSTAEAGASDYLGLLERRYAPALDAARSGDIQGFVHDLHEGGYFTAPENGYLRSMQSIAGVAQSALVTPSAGTASNALSASSGPDISNAHEANLIASFGPGVSTSGDPLRDSQGMALALDAIASASRRSGSNNDDERDTLD